MGRSQSFKINQVDRESLNLYISFLESNWPQIVRTFLDFLSTANQQGKLELDKSLFKMNQQIEKIGARLNK